MPPEAFGIIIPGFFFTLIVSIVSVAVVKAARAFASRVDFTERLLAKAPEART